MKIIIIGAGVAGLSAGIYARKNGFECEIYEQHFVPGGECTAWNRKGYTIDGSISWLTGLKKNTKIYDTWMETGAFNEEDIVLDPIFSVIQSDQKLIWYRDLERLREEMIRISPEDKDEIEKFIYVLSQLKEFEFPAGKPMDIMDAKEKLTFINAMMKVFQAMGDDCSKKTEEYVQRFSSKLIQQAIQSFTFRDNLVQGVLITLAAVASNQAGWVKGGSKRLTENMKNKYLELGGKLFCNSKVSEILIESNDAKGIRLEDGRIIKGDYIVPACDLYVSLKKLLKDSYRDKTFDKFYSSDEYKTSSIAQVTFGVDCNLANYPSKSIFLFDRRSIGNEMIDSCCFTHYCGEETFAPLGKSVIKTGLTVYHYDDWENLSSEEYQRKKQEIKQVYQDLLHKYYPETIGKIEMVDITTPKTYERFCGAYKGAYMAFMLTKETNKISHSGKLQQVDHLFLAGQWLSALGGLPDAVVSGKNAIMRICKRENMCFQGVQ